MREECRTDSISKFYETILFFALFESLTDNSNFEIRFYFITHSKPYKRSIRVKGT